MANSDFSQSEAALDARASRTAKRIGLLALKRTWRKGTVDNQGGYYLLDPFTNCVVTGVRLDLSATDAIDYWFTRTDIS